MGLRKSMVGYDSMRNTSDVAPQEAALRRPCERYGLDDLLAERNVCKGYTYFHLRSVRDGAYTPAYMDQMHGQHLPKTIIYLLQQHARNLY